MHVLFLPKWYPGPHDPQLGDFLRKQALAAAAHVHMSVLQVEAVPNGALDDRLVTANGAWELSVCYRANTSPWRPWRKTVNLIRYWRTSLRGWRRMLSERGKPDLLHAYILVRPALFAWWLGRKHGIPYIISEQSSEYLDGTWQAKGALFKWLNRCLARKASAITAVSTWLGDALVACELCATYDVVPNVVPGLDRPLPAQGPPGHFMMVADLVDKTKNISGVMRALAIARATDARLQLTIIGDGADRAQLGSLVTKLALSDHVRFLGRLSNDDVLDHMATTFAVIVNSNVETFSVVTGEALAQGKPVIATRCGGPEAFITPVNGILIPVRDDEALARAMLELTTSADRYVRTVIRQSVGDRCSMPAVGRAFHSIYQRMVPSHGE